MTIEDIKRFLPGPVLGKKFRCLKVYFPAADTLSEKEIEDGPDVMSISDESGQTLLEYRFGTIITTLYDEGRKYQTKEVSDTEERLSTYEYTPDGDLYHTREIILSTADPFSQSEKSIFSIVFVFSSKDLGLFVIFATTDIRPPWKLKSPY